MSDNNSAVQTELPKIIEINGVAYERVDYSEDHATKLLRRIEGVAKASGFGLPWAAWAVAAIFDKANGKQINPWPR